MINISEWERLSTTEKEALLKVHQQQLDDLMIGINDKLGKKLNGLRNVE
jgi:hypothetical protein